MSVLIRSGRRVCNATCYNAKTPAESCKCICGGSNHGVGKKAAIERMRAWARAQIKDANEVLVNCFCAEMPVLSTKNQRNVFGGMNGGIEI